ncbi:MAG: rRNA maturation RNase YbeY [Clostridia bacterium]|nr:rRNA maturation RNase YbeY [Clostridia bacterium]
MSAFFLQTEGEELSRACVENIQKAMTDFVQADIPLCVEVVFVEEAEIRSLNAQTRGLDKVTDVLSYPTLDNIRGKAIKGADYPFDIDEEGNLLIGSIAVCVQRAKEQAVEYGHSFERELHYLIVHGIMHCLGYDHMTDEDKAQMREKEERILGKLGITRE